MEIVSFEIAKKLKEKGFDYPCSDAINSFGCTYRNGWCEYLDDRNNELITLADLHKGDYLLPTISQVLKWLREEKRIDVGAVWDNRDEKWVGYVNEMDMPDLVGEYILSNTYDFYESAAIAGIEYTLDNLI